MQNGSLASLQSSPIAPTSREISSRRCCSAAVNVDWPMMIERTIDFQVASRRDGAFVDLALEDFLVVDLLEQDRGLIFRAPDRGGAAARAARLAIERQHREQRADAPRRPAAPRASAAGCRDRAAARRTRRPRGRSNRAACRRAAARAASPRAASCRRRRRRSRRRSGARPPSRPRDVRADRSPSCAGQWSSRGRTRPRVASRRRLIPRAGP